MNTARVLTARLADLLAREHGDLADFLLALADFDRRRLWVELGYSGLFMFLHRELGLSKGAAYYRKVAAELIQRVPEMVEPLRDGRLCITSIAELAKVLTPENHREVLPRFFHRSRREAMEVTAELRPDPTPPRRDVVTKVCATPPAAAELRVDAAAREPRLPRAPHRRALPIPRDGLPPLSPEARGGDGRALAQESGGERLRDPGVGPGPRPRRAREAEGVREE